MKFFPAIDPHAVHIKDNNVITTSIVVAKMFGKQHKDILRKIKTIECSDVFRSANFCAHPYTNSQNGETYIQYDITKDGFIFLVMGFTGKKASHMKEAYINAFNKMEAEVIEWKIKNERKSIPQATMQATRLLMTLQNGIITNSQIMPANCLAISPKEIPEVIRTGEFIGTRDLHTILQAASEMILKRSII